MGSGLRIVRASLCALVALALALAAPAAEAGSPLNVRVAKKATGPFQSGELQVKIPAGKTRNLYLRVKNLDTATRSVTLTEVASSTPLGYKRTWFKGRRNITSKVRGSGFDFRLKGTARKSFRLRVRARESPGAGCVGGRFDTAAPEGPAFGLFELNANPGFCSG